MVWTDSFLSRLSSPRGFEGHSFGKPGEGLLFFVFLAGASVQDFGFRVGHIGLPPTLRSSSCKLLQKILGQTPLRQAFFKTRAAPTAETYRSSSPYPSQLLGLHHIHPHFKSPHPSDVCNLEKIFALSTPYPNLRPQSLVNPISPKHDVLMV